MKSQLINQGVQSELTNFSHYLLQQSRVKFRLKINEKIAMNGVENKN